LSVIEDQVRAGDEYEGDECGEENAEGERGSHGYEELSLEAAFE